MKDTTKPTSDGMPLFSIEHTPEMWARIVSGLPNLIKKLNGNP